MTDITSTDRLSLRNAVLDGLQRLRAAFPLEARLQAAPADLREVYRNVLASWLSATVPQPARFDPERLRSLQALDAVVPGPEGIGCYPFSARPTGIHVQLPGGAVQAMCAIDALAVARLAATTTEIESVCLHCQSPLTIRQEANGGLDHDQADCARVVWEATACEHHSCSEGLCRHIRFLCTHCPPPTGGTCYSLPQAAAIGNAFFAFQSALRPAGPIRD
jgi:hypothetical protein